MKLVTKSAKTLMTAALAVGLVGSISSCKKEGCMDPEATNFDEEAKKECDDDCCQYKTEDTKTGQITSDETWTSDKVYFLEGKVVVASGATLTIEPGTIIKGMEGQDAAASALVVARGGKIMAVGTADDPIIFTSSLDDIAIGGKVGSNLSKTDNQLWGGVAILGKAKVSTETGDTEGNLEGIPADEGYGKYGGSDDSDNSGTLAYVSIRHGGISIGEGNELNGLTLAGVGNGTSISNIEIYATLDDGIECFGGSVNISNALVFYQGDDGIDLDQNYSGTISNFAVIHGDGIGTDEGLEIDGPEGSTYTDGRFTLTNGLCKSEGSEGSAADFKSKAQGNVNNVTFEYGGSAKLKFRASYNEDCSVKSDAAKYIVDSKLVISNSKMSSIEVYENADEDTCIDEVAAAQIAVSALISTSGSGSSMNAASTFSWSAAGTRGEL